MAAPPSPAHVRRLWHQRQLGRNRHSTGGPSARRPRFRQSPAVLADPRDPGRSPPSIQAARHRWRGETAGLGPAVSMEADASSSSTRAILGPRAARHGWRGETRRRKQRTRPRPLPVSVAPSARLFPPSPHAHSPPKPPRSQARHPLYKAGILPSFRHVSAPPTLRTRGIWPRGGCRPPPAAGRTCRTAGAPVSASVPPRPRRDPNRHAGPEGGGDRVSWSGEVG